MENKIIEAARKLSKGVLDHLQSKLNQDIDPQPSLNALAILAYDLNKIT